MRLRDRLLGRVRELSIIVAATLSILVILEAAVRPYFPDITLGFAAVADYEI